MNTEQNRTAPCRGNPAEAPRLTKEERKRLLIDPPDEPDLGSGPEGQARREAYLAAHGFQCVEQSATHHRDGDMATTLPRARRDLDRRLDAPSRRCSATPMRPRPRAVRPGSRPRRSPRASRAGPGSDDGDSDAAGEPEPAAARRGWSA